MQMKNKNFIITLTGPSQSGKSLVMNKIMRLEKKINSQGGGFAPKKIKKYTTRHLRLDEVEMGEAGQPADVEFIKKIPEDCDLVYQTYGIRYGLSTEILRKNLMEGFSPIVVINDIRAVEEIRREFPGKVLSLFLFRKIPELVDFQDEAKKRGNVSAQEVTARYEKAISIYKTYVENISLFDHVILNVIEYEPEILMNEETILDFQLNNIISSLITGAKELNCDEKGEHRSRIFVIAGNAASGKDEIIRALLSMGKLEAQVLPKYTMRQMEPADGQEMICRYIPKKEIIKKFREECQRQKQELFDLFSKVEQDLNKEFKRQFIEFRQELEDSILDEYDRFWLLQNEKKINNDFLINNYFELNENYIDLYDIKKTANKEFESEGVGIYEKKGKKYVIYGKDDRLYGCDVTNVSVGVGGNGKHYVIVASELGVVKCLKHLYSEENVKFIYAHSEISESEFEAKALDTTKEQKRKEFAHILENYTKFISDFDHVTIYANAKLTYEQTSKEEELIDQMFRLLRAY